MLASGIMHSSPEVKKRGPEVCSQIGPDVKGSVPALVELLSDPDTKVKWSANTVLEQGDRTCGRVRDPSSLDPSR